MGPNIDPCGIPKVIDVNEDSALLWTVHCFLWLK